VDPVRCRIPRRHGRVAIDSDPPASPFDIATGSLRGGTAESYEADRERSPARGMTGGT